MTTALELNAHGLDPAQDTCVTISSDHCLPLSGLYQAQLLEVCVTTLAVHVLTCLKDGKLAGEQHMPPDRGSTCLDNLGVGCLGSLGHRDAAADVH
mmetsp:Transcript_41558/g.110369  ORF Transcript_41558/g.110369 Transcript_41558/m.110369 type:complete len:96 (+) Transcript_41558:32-319(+)|eukprot:6309109-Prymnesium_polylepis.1